MGAVAELGSFARRINRSSALTALHFIKFSTPNREAKASCRLTLWLGASLRERGSRKIRKRLAVISRRPVAHAAEPDAPVAVFEHAIDILRRQPFPLSEMRECLAIIARGAASFFQRMSKPHVSR